MEQSPHTTEPNATEACIGDSPFAFGSPDPASNKFEAPSRTPHNTEIPRNISEFLATFLLVHESFLRDLAAKEQADGTFSPSPSRFIDLLDNPELWRR